MTYCLCFQLVFQPFGQDVRKVASQSYRKDTKLDGVKVCSLCILLVQVVGIILVTYRICFLDEYMSSQVAGNLINRGITVDK